MKKKQKSYTLVYSARATELARSQGRPDGSKSEERDEKEPVTPRSENERLKGFKRAFPQLPLWPELERH